MVAELPVQLFEAGYSKQQELDADRYGTTLAVGAGYSPQGAIQMFRKFQQLEDAVEGRRSPQESGAVDLPVDIANVVVVQSVQEYFRSHPPPEERIYQIERLIGSEHWSSNPPQLPLQVATAKGE
jgi:predicted Zn-dependent protease